MIELKITLRKKVSMSKQNYLTNIYRGKVATCYGIETGIDKYPVEKSLYLSFDGLEGDQCADQVNHGGIDRALHQYPQEHYAFWQKQYGNHVDWVAPGMGENLSSLGMTEDTVFLGDRYQWNEAIIEVSQPRSPCFKLNKRWNIDDLSSEMQGNSRCGWLYRVIKPGMVSVHEPLKLIERTANAMTIRELSEAFFNEPLNKANLLKLRQQNALSDSWMDKVVQRLETNQLESWSFRLFGE